MEPREGVATRYSGAKRMRVSTERKGMAPLGRWAIYLAGRHQGRDEGGCLSAGDHPAENQKNQRWGHLPTRKKGRLFPGGVGRIQVSSHNNTRMRGEVLECSPEIENPTT